MLALAGAFIAGVLTTLAPCVLPMLPVIVGGSIAGQGSDRRRAYVIAASLGVSVVLFTLALKASTVLIEIPPQAWAYVSGGLLIALGLVSLFPGVWDRASAALSLQARTTGGLSHARRHNGFAGQVLIGAALGPVFSSCSPLYAYVVVTVLPAEFGYGILLLAAYVLGLCGTLLVISLLGQRFVQRMGWAADPHGWFRRGLGVVFVLVGLFVLTGADKDVQAWIIENSPIRPWELDSGFIPES
ncbi:MAG: cytochrome c biogenesis protein CcdA [Candidatus Nanopelagicales bacterium]